jgi:hypothetical protein
MGGVLFVVFIIALFIFPDPQSNNFQNRKDATTLPLWPLLKTPQFLLPLLMLFCGSLSVTFVEPAIQLHLEPVN